MPWLHVAAVHSAQACLDKLAKTGYVAAWHASLNVNEWALAACTAVNNLQYWSPEPFVCQRMEWLSWRLCTITWKLMTADWPSQWCIDFYEWPRQQHWIDWEKENSFLDAKINEWYWNDLVFSLASYLITRFWLDNLSYTMRHTSISSCYRNTS